MLTQNLGDFPDARASLPILIRPRLTLAASMESWLGARSGRFSISAKGIGYFHGIGPQSTGFHDPAVRAQVILRLDKWFSRRDQGIHAGACCSVENSHINNWSVSEFGACRTISAAPFQKTRIIGV